MQETLITYSIAGWVGPRASLSVLNKRESYSPPQLLQLSIVQPIA